MNKLSKFLYSAIVSTLFAGTAWAADMATPDEAKAMSDKAMKAVQDMGREKAFAAFSDAKGGFQEKDLYVFCMDMQGVMLSHAKKPDLVGKNLIDFNKYGDALFQDMIKVAKSGEGWVDYKWPYPGTEEVRQKTSYVIADNNKEFFCGVGAYK